MYDQIRGDIFFTLLYSAVATMALLSGCYLLFSKTNAFVINVTTSKRLRRWTGLFFVALALNHVWYMPLFYLSSSDDILTTDLIGGMLDNLTVFPLSIAILFVMLQDRRRPLWPIVVMTAPIALGMAVCAVRHSAALYPAMYAYVVLLVVGLIIYMVREVRQYGRWLRDNYADLEHKEVWQSLVVLAIILLMFGFYESSDEGAAYPYIMQAICIVLISYLLWRVETLSDLSEIATRKEEREAEEEEAPRESRIYGNSENIESSLKQYCEEPHLYLQHDISVTELAKQIGTNRSYLSKYFAQQGVTYNGYINGLRIRHFVKLYHDVCAMRQSATTKQLAYQSGFRSYSTFNAAFKQSMGMTATEWMHAEEQEADSAGEQSTSES